jgi:acyl-CoA thioesterase-1
MAARGSGAPRAGQAARIGVVTVVFVAGLAAGCGGHSSKTTGPTTAGSSNARVTAIGDSITAGKPPTVPYPPRLEALLRRRNPEAEVINRGMGGQTTAGLRDTLALALGVDRPGFVVLLAGTNDVNVGTPAAESAGNLREMVVLAKRSRVVPVLATIPPQFGDRIGALPAVVALNDAIRRVAAEEHVVLADVFAAIPDAGYMTSDGFHPNDQGELAIAVVFDAALARAGYPTARLVARNR